METEPRPTIFTCIEDLIKDKVFWTCWFVMIAVMFIFIFSVIECHAQIIQPAQIDLNKIAQIESSGNPRAWRKNDDSRGLFQITPVCLRDWNQLHTRDQHSADNLWDPAVNLKIASWYLNVRIPQMLKHYEINDTVKNRIWAYNAGIGNVVKGRVPDITKKYFKKYFKS